MTATSAEFRFWVDMALECVRRDHTQTISAGDQRGPFLSSRALGLALGALHDMAAPAWGGPQLLSVAPPALPGTQDVAAAAAIHEVLLRRFPKQQGLLEAAWRQWQELYALSNAAAEAAGRAHGKAVEALGVDDPDNAMRDRYTATGADYTHQRPDHEPTQSYAGGEWGMSKELLVPIVPGFARPFARQSPALVTPDPEYMADFNHVKAKGHWSRTYGGPNGRTAEEELIGIYWGYDGPAHLGTPPRLYLQVLLTVLDDLEARTAGALGVSDELLLIGGAAVAMADAAISAWHYKYSADHMMWRPVVGVRKEKGLNGVADPDWLPLGRPDTNGTGLYLTPDFPAYPSGHATFGAAAFELARLFLAEKGLAKFDARGVDDIRFDFVSDEFNGRNEDPRTRQPRTPITRGYGSLWDAIVDNSISRVFLGVHWQFDGISLKAGTGSKFGVPKAPDELGDVGGVWLGVQIARAVATQKLGVSAGTVLNSKMP